MPNFEIIKLSVCVFVILIMEVFWIMFLSKEKHLKNENRRLWDYIKHQYMGGVCDTCEYCQCTESNGGDVVEYDMWCTKGHDNMGIDNCDDYELSSKIISEVMGE